LQIARGFLDQILVVAIASVKQRLAPDVVLARGAVEDIGPNQRDSLARQEHVEIHHVDHADDLCLRLGLDAQATQGERIVHRFPFQLSQIGITRRRGGSRQQEEEKQASAAHAPRFYPRNHRRRLCLVWLCAAWLQRKSDKPGTSGEHSTGSRRESRRIQEAANCWQPSGGKIR
jgi:hypothetical protein